MMDSVAPIRRMFRGSIASAKRIFRDAALARLGTPLLGDIVAHVSEYAIFRLGVDGTVLSWNDGAHRIEGYDESEIVGKHFSIFYTPEDIDAGMPAQALEMARNGRFHAEGWRVRKDGRLFWADIDISPTSWDRHGDITGFTKITKDLTLQEETSQRIAEMQKREALGQLTGGVAHDVNGLLTIQAGAVELIRSTLSKVTMTEAERLRLERHLGMIQDTCTRGAALTRQLLAFARKQPLKPTLMDPVTVLRDAIDMLAKTTLSRSIVVSKTIPLSLPLLKVDTSQFATALLNIVLNARDAMPNGGELRVSAALVQLHGAGKWEPGDRGVAGANALVGEFVSITITDTGTGIAEDRLSKVTEPFYTTKNIGKGSGLGLSQAYGFCQQSGGALSIESEIGVGTTVTFLLPASADQLALPAPTVDVVEAVGRPFTRVLLVEDDPDIAEVTQAALYEAGYHVSRVTSVATAINQLTAYPFDLVITDVLLHGGQSGLELVAWVKGQRPQASLLLTSGYHEITDRQDELTEIILAKPYLPRDILSAIHGLEARRGPQ